MNDVNTQGNRRSMNERMMASMQPDPSQPKSAFSPFPALDQTTSRAYIHNLDRTTRRSPIAQHCTQKVLMISNKQADHGIAATGTTKLMQ
jgi:hypothetical protein